MQPSHLPAQGFYKKLGISKQTFYWYVSKYEVDYIELYGGARLYSVKDWNKKTKHKMDSKK